MNIIHKITTQGKHPLMSEQHDDVIDVTPHLEITIKMWNKI